MSKLFSVATFVALIGLLVLLCTAAPVTASVTTAAQAAPVATATVSAAPTTNAPAQASESGVLYVANHGAWG